MTCDYKSESGNALFLIFLAVALLAGLTYAVSQNRTGSTDHITEERARLIAGEIMEYGSTLANAVAQLRLRGCSEDQISFENDFVASYANAGAPADESCHIFSASGGGVSWLQVPTDWLVSTHSAEANYGAPFFVAGSCVVDVGTDSGADVCNSDGDEELLFTISWLKENVCEELNELSGVTNVGGDVPSDNGTPWDNTNFFDGTFAGSDEIGDGAAGNASELRGKKSGCFNGGSNPFPPGSYHFFRVLVIN